MTKVVNYLLNDDGYHAKVVYSETNELSIQYYTPANFLIATDDCHGMTVDEAKNVATQRLENVTRLWKEDTKNSEKTVILG